MSTRYVVKEHLIIRNNEDEGYITSKSELADMMSCQLAALGGMMLLDLVGYCEIKLITDEETISFEGICPDESFKKIVASVSGSANIELVSEYTCSGYGWFGLSGPENMKDFLENGENLEELETKLNDIFYSAWYKEDSDEAEGSLCAFGKYNGKKYNGEIGYEETDVFPEGNWLAENGVAVDANTGGISSYPCMEKSSMSEEIFELAKKQAENQRVAPEQLKQVENICQELMKLAKAEEDYEIDVTDETIEYSMWSHQLKNAKDMDTYFSLYKQLMSINEAIASWPYEYFVDTTGDHVRQMRVHMNGSDRPLFEISEIK